MVQLRGIDTRSTYCMLLVYSWNLLLVSIPLFTFVFFLVLYPLHECLQCFDAVGWVA